MIDCLDPQKNPEVAYFSSFLALNLFLLLSCLPPFNLCIIFATKLTSFCLCLSHFVTVSFCISPHLLKHQIPVLSFDGVLLSLCLCLSLSCCSVVHIIQYWRCQLGTSRLLPTPENTPLTKWACVEAKPLSLTRTHTQITRWGLRWHIVSVTAKLIRHTRKDTRSGTCFQDGTCHTHDFLQVPTASKAPKLPPSVS